MAGAALGPPPTAVHAPAIPRIAGGVELIGRFEDSGFKEPPFIARRSDGQVVQMAAMLFALAEEIDGRRDYPEIAERLSHRIQRGVTGEMAEMLVEEQLRPLGIVAPSDGAEPELRKVDPLLALKFRTKVVPERVTSALTRVFRPLFHGPVVLAVVTAFVALVGWVLGVHGISQSLRHVIYQPALVLMLIGGVVLATALHEVGHATACRYGGAKPGVMGVGVYIVWPAFYTDITDAYRLDKRGRLRTDLGGMYFNAVFALAVGGLYAATGFEPLLLLIVLQVFAIVQQSLPFLRLDGYYIVSDLTGVPDILVRMRSILASVLPWRRPDERVTELKPWVRVAVTAYVCLLVPVVAFMFLVMLINAPRVFATGWDSFWVHFDQVGPDFSRGDTGRGAIALFQMLVLVLPALGIAYTTARVAHRGGTLGWRWSDGSPLRRGGLAAAAAALLALAAFLLWPQGEYRPIQPGERGTLLGAVRQLSDVPGGRPSLTLERERQLRGAPSERQLRRQGGAGIPRGGGADSGRKARDKSATPTSGSGAAQKPSSQPQGYTSTPSQQDTTTTQPQSQPPAYQQTAPAAPPQDGSAQPSGSGTTTTPTSP